LHTNRIRFVSVVTPRKIMMPSMDIAGNANAHYLVNGGRRITMTQTEYFLGIAEAVSRRSHCLSHKFGAVAVRDDHVISMGYNGPPKGYPHCQGDICPRHKIGYDSGQGLEICPAVHAEMNVLIQAARFGISLDGATMFVTSPTPCRECSKAIVNAGIIEVVIGNTGIYPDIGLKGGDILRDCGVSVMKLVGYIEIPH
jgi:dCMP deaminase